MSLEIIIGLILGGAFTLMAGAYFFGLYKFSKYFG
jgi:hypothetical protein